MTDAAPDPTLRCRECGTNASAGGPQYCARCFGPVEVILAPPTEGAAEVRSAISNGPASIARYSPLLPPGMAIGGSGAGWTPLRAAPGLSAEIGLADLWLKDETANPTGSFKDRVVDAAIARGLAQGARVVACSSTGNLARAVAHGAAARGLRAIVFVPDELSDDQRDELVGFGAHVVVVRGGYDSVSRLTAEAAADLGHWAWVNVTLRPWYELGARTLAWEISEQAGWTLPDRVVVPMASGALARALFDGFGHLIEWGLVSGTMPRLTVVEPAGCAPVVAAYEEGASRVRPVRPDTVAGSLAMGDPPDGEAVLAAARASGGQVVAAAEGEILPAAELLERIEKIAVEPAGGVVIAALARLVADGTVGTDERVVAVLTGAAVGTRVAGLVPGVGGTDTIDPSVGALMVALPADIVRN
ncbi:MAG: threonine synthase [Acidimicrobiia bacterium]|nr:threonine synthase [Acidimicrobiia bacterium]